MKVKNSIIFAMILAASLSRLIPHLPNMTAVSAMALFAGSMWGLSVATFLIPMAIMSLTDLVFGLHPTMTYVYGSFVAISLLGALFLRERRGVKVVAFSLLSSALFFAITNLGYWAEGGFYPHNFSGLVECYVAGLPFVKNQVVGDLMYSAILFAAYDFVIRRNERTVASL